MASTQPPKNPSRNQQLSQRAARSKGLQYVSDATPGLHRKARGKHFSYTDARGRTITAVRVLDRIRRLAIPPAYHDVWICPDPRGHIQATGIDARGRKQYRYHADWRTVRDANKFGRMIEFGARLSVLRNRLRADLRLKGLPQPKVLATMVSVMQSTLVRVGNEDYMRSNNSFGLTTLRDRHLQHVNREHIKIQFRGKSGQLQTLELRDRQLARLVRHCQDLPGQQLFQYLDEVGRPQPINSGMINGYLLDEMGVSADGTGFTAKDFRTWGATMHAIRLLSAAPQEGKRDAKQVAPEVCRGVAKLLGNTPAVCRKSYINPWVFDAWEKGFINEQASTPLRPTAMEHYALSVLRRERRQGARRPAV
jgi:DNA topoisomerase I